MNGNVQRGRRPDDGSQIIAQYQKEHDHGYEESDENHQHESTKPKARKTAKAATKKTAPVKQAKADQRTGDAPTARSGHQPGLSRTPVQSQGFLDSA